MVHEKNRFLYSPFVIILWGILTFFAFAFSKELEFYGLVVAYALYVIAFCDDLAPLMPLFLLCYVTPSVSNNPGMAEGGLFYGATGKIIIGYAIIVVIALMLRITFDSNIGWGKLFKMPRVLLGGMLALGAVYLLSGIGSANYFEEAERNLVFALVQFASVCLLYFAFTAMVDWERFDIDYFAWSGLVAGLVVLAELVWIYQTQDVIVYGAVRRAMIYAGWGMYNNMGLIMGTSIPFAFYLAQRKKHNAIYLILGLVLAVGVLFTCSRGSIVFAALVTFFSYIYTFVKAENKKEFAITSIFLAVLLAIAGVMLREKLIDFFNKVPLIYEYVDGDVVFNTSGRFNIYRQGIEIFLKNPILGNGFYFDGYTIGEFSVVDRFSSFFPPRLHNTIVQILATCGVAGILAYLFHRGQTVWVLVKRWSIENAYIALYLFALLGMSLLDCHFFNAGPVLFYSMALAVAEFGQSREGALD